MVRQKLNSLIAQGRLSVETLEIATGIKGSVIARFLEGEDWERLSDDMMESSRLHQKLTGIAVLLSEGMEVPEDERVKGIIDVLHEVYKMDDKMIAEYAGLTEAEVKKFVENPNEIAYEKRYVLAVKVFSIVNGLKV